MTDTPSRIRRARPDEATELTTLALRSKALWGYDAAFIEQCRGALTLSADRVAASLFYVLEEGGAFAGFYGLAGAPPAADLEFLFVAPDRTRRGCGRRLFRDAAARARRFGCERLTILADPFAERFYARMGAVRIGEAPSEAIPGRMLPLLSFPLIAGTGRRHGRLA